MRLFRSLLVGLVFSIDTVISQIPQLISYNDQEIDIRINSDLGKVLKDFLDKETFCPNMKMRAVALEARQDRIQQCLTDIAHAISKNAFLITNLLALYRAAPIAGDIPDVEALPGFADDSVAGAFVQTWMENAMTMLSGVPDIFEVEVPWQLMVILSIARERIWNHPNTFENFAVGRKGQMRLSCEPKEDIPCNSPLCLAGDTTQCTGFFKPCECTKGECLPDQNEYLCDEECGGMDDTFGWCKGRQEDNFKQKGCPCSKFEYPEPYDWNDWDALQKAQDETQLIILGDEFKPPANKLECRKQGDDVKNDKTLKSWAFVNQATLDDNIRSMCNDFFKGVDNANGDGSTKHLFNQGGLDEVWLSIAWEQEATKTQADCEKEFIRVSSDCDSNTDVYDWKWGGKLALGLMTYTVTPTQQRVVTEDPGWDGSHWFEVHQEHQDRIGKNGKPWDMMQVTECIHDLRRHDWGWTGGERGGGPYDCAGFFTTAVSGDVGYESWEDCFQNTWRYMSWKVMFDESISLDVFHRGGAGPAGVKCFIRIDQYDIPKPV